MNWPAIPTPHGEGKPDQVRETPGNRCMVGVQGETVVLLRASAAQCMTKRQALELAAWLVSLADDHGEFPAILEAVKS